MSEASSASESRQSQAAKVRKLWNIAVNRIRHTPPVKEQREQWLPRLAGHVALVVTVLVVAWLAAPRPQAAPDAPIVPLPEQRPYSVLSARGGPRMSDDGLFHRAPVPHTTIPERPRREVITYTVQYGDTLYGVAEQFGISAETVMWANADLEMNPDLLQIGQELVILPISGVYHKVAQGDTVESIAAKYKIEPGAILECEYNSIGEDGALTVGQYIIAPGGRKPYVPRVVHVYTGPVPEGASRGTGRFVWPTSGTITQRFHELHRAIDIAWAEGTPIVASDSGYVAIVGSSNTGYGKYVVIDHGNGFQTLYAHFSIFYVKVGQSVSKGQTIGLMGSTGRSTGPHLHFEVRQNGVQRNPLNWLP